MPSHIAGKAFEVSVDSADQVERDARRQVGG
jgi:hypothetical protein